MSKGYQLITVTNRRQECMFLDVAREIYRSDPVWVCPMDSEVRHQFDPRINTYLKEGEASRWVLLKDGKLAGRIAAFYHGKKAYKYDQPTGGVGYFECIPSEEAARILFDTGRRWLEGKGMKAMDGPVNPGENTNYWGLLVEGFTHPAYGMNYHPPYYQEFFENYGFKPYFRQETRHLDLNRPFPERFWRIAEWTMNRHHLHFRHFLYQETEKFMRDVKEVHDQAWQFHEHFIPLDIGELRKQLMDARPVLEEDMIWFAYLGEQPVAFMVMIPDANQILKYFKGKMDPWNRLRFIWLKKRNTITRTRVTALGVIPKFQGQGIESALFWHLQVPLLGKRPHIKEIEISWVGDFNPKMQALLEALQANPGKIHLTYRKLFDDSAHFNYSKIIPMDTRYIRKRSKN